ncbi:acetylcholinesterase [Diachasma alloeum]|uniref:acetylcholinesterase n=1 Tax=Diachasma alloeum TaxID=454923 RepID=UPI0007382B55|nr:acetylcholinesterase [Diachasma alloeum]
MALFGKYTAFVLLLTVVAYFSIAVVCELTAVIETDRGPVVGEILRTVMNSVPYGSFRGIPYARPPINDLRFQPPEEAEPWVHVLEATAEGNQCPQMDFIKDTFSGNEDCLYLNVYTPKVNYDETSSSDLLPVMVWIHGGKFATGYANASYYGPDFILEENVVMVAANFRLDILGFLALNIPEASENLQLKDQVLVLKWVQRNIQKFGGDPNRVTIFGCSSGGVDVDLHMISDASRGLFHGAIAMSSAPWSAWTFLTRNQSETRAFHLGKVLGIDTEDKTTLYRELMKKTPEDLVTGGEKLLPNLIHADRKFKPIIEDARVAGVDAFLTECPIKKYKAGSFAQVPFMSGFMRDEMLSFTTSTQNLHWYVELALKQFAGCHHPVQEKLTHLYDELSKVLHKHISELPVELVTQAINHITNTLYRPVIDQKVKLVAEMSSAPAYYYQNSYNAEEYSYHRLQARIIPSLTGAGHGDDLFTIFHVSIFDLPLDADHPFSKARKRMVRMITNFAKYGNPTPDGTSDPVLNITWPRAPGKYMEINDQLTIGDSPLNEDAKSIQKDLSGLVWDEFNGCDQSQSR